MEPAPNAVELTVDHAWFIAETIGAGSFPWVLAITCPYRDAAERNAFLDRQKAELTQMGLVSEGGLINPAVAEWIKVVCFPERWLDLRYVGPAKDAGAAGGAGELLRGIVAQRAGPAAGRRGRWSRCAARS
ncbi:espG family protein [Mycobacterium intracellulare 1956]|uniref:EspG family protein n=1 Tax=Mycobacterium intracellulare 1956 TaxID=1299331 RepID=X8CCS9_MYCIT|nr:espG family protein [Mycobacterium intracellulare 1956]